MSTADRIYEQAVSADIAEIAGYLQELLGQRMVAYLSGVKDEKMVGRWAAGRNAPRRSVESRLRVAYQAAKVLEPEGASTVWAWFAGANPQLSDGAPARVLRHYEEPVGATEVVSAAKAFAATEFS